MAANVQEERKSESFDEEVNILISEIANILSLSTNEAAKPHLKADIS